MPDINFIQKKHATILISWLHIDDYSNDFVGHYLGNVQPNCKFLLSELSHNYQKGVGHGDMEV
jgi:hypothetical protein